ncbi:hypothetical protein GCM10010207_47630 [Streptomyces atratus]|nr:hypothetical protein GCM10010207_47630 [Streptomyces atratus]
MRPRPMLRESPSKTVVPSGHWKDRAEQVRDALGAVGVAMVILAVASTVNGGLRMRAPRSDRTEREVRRSERSRDGSCTEVASTRGHGQD